MAAYDSFARFYDELMDEAAEANAKRVSAAIERYLPAARSLLELGCGTGAVLARLPTITALTGIDVSQEMLAIAAQKVPQARLIEANMASFDLQERFDVVICVYDTLNHLVSYDDWLELFRRVGEHVAEGGLFIFDVNTIGRLRQSGEDQPWVHDFGGCTLIIDTEWSEDDRISAWDVRVFEPLDDGHFALNRERITELGVPVSGIKESLDPRFELLDESDPVGAGPTDDSARAYFVYRRRS